MLGVYPKLLDLMSPPLAPNNDPTLLRNLVYH